MKRYLVLGAMLALGLLICSGISFAQEEEEAVEETDYSWGIVKSLSSNQIIVTEYDYDRDEEVDVAYTIDPNVKFYNVNSLKEITVGDSLEIDYVVRGDTNVAKVITVEKPSHEKEYTPSQTYEEESDYSSDEIEY